MLKKFSIKQEANDANGTGYGTPAPGDLPPPKAPVSPVPPAAPAKDDFGYDTDVPEIPEVIEDEKIEDPATGYGDEPIVPPPAVPPVVVPPAVIDPGYEIDVKDLEQKEADFIKTFAKENKLSKEAAQSFANLRRSEGLAVIEQNKKAQESFEREVKETRANWDKELRTDKNFGGERFSHNVLQVEKFMKDFLPETRKTLTERKSMLPPYVMRDLAKAAEAFYATDKLVRGENLESPILEKEDSHLEFYK